MQTNNGRDQQDPIIAMAGKSTTAIRGIIVGSAELKHSADLHKHFHPQP